MNHHADVWFFMFLMWVPFLVVLVWYFRAERRLKREEGAGRP